MHYRKKSNDVCVCVFVLSDVLWPTTQYTARMHVSEYEGFGDIYFSKKYEAVMKKIPVIATVSI